MRFFTISRLTLVELGGWATLGLLFWLLLFTHNVIARPMGPLTSNVSEETILLPPPAQLADEPLAGPPTHGKDVVQQRANEMFWQTRLRLRHDLPVRGMLGIWMPSRSRYYMAERRRFLKREAMRPKPVVLPRRASSNLGPALGSVYCRPLV